MQRSIVGLWTSSRRLRRGLLYNLVVTLVVYYLSAYLLNRLFGRRIVGSAPPCRTDCPRCSPRVWLGVGVVLAVVLVLLPGAGIGDAVASASHSVIERLSVVVDPDEGR